MLLASLYYLFLSADRYVSESIITVRTAEDDGPASSEKMAAGLALGLPVGGPSATDVNYLKDYIYSVDMLKHLDEKLGLRAVYEGQTRDVFFRLFPGVSQEWFLWYYRNRVEVSLDTATSTIYLKVEGFKPADAEAINQEILAESERFINQISYRMAEEQMGYAERYLAKAQERYQRTKDRLIEFQDLNQLFDPVAQAQAKAGLGNELEGELARSEAELRNELTYLNEKSYQIIALKNKIAATRAQIEEVRRRAAASEGQHLNELAGQFQRLSLDASFAEDTYRASLSTVEKIRLETSRKLKHLVVISKPTLPEWPLYPRRIYNLATLLVVLTLLYGIARLVVAIVEDHRD
jgi:capsular polysaccharide transport system permease protein